MERLRLKPWAPIPVDASADVIVPNASAEVQTVLLPPSPRAASMESERRLAYHFLTLPHHERVEIVVRLGLVRDEDEGVRDRELFGRVFQRALDERRLADLWLEVERRHPNGQPDPNPFHR